MFSRRANKYPCRLDTTCCHPSFVVPCHGACYHRHGWRSLPQIASCTFKLPTPQSAAALPPAIVVNASARSSTTFKHPITSLSESVARSISVSLESAIYAYLAGTTSKYLATTSSSAITTPSATIWLTSDCSRSTKTSTVSPSQHTITSYSRHICCALAFFARSKPMCMA